MLTTSYKKKKLLQPKSGKSKRRLHSIVRIIKSRRIRWAGHVACMGERRGVYRVLVGKPEGKNHLGDPSIDGRIILRWIWM